MAMSSEKERAAIAVVGGGLAGLLAALRFADICQSRNQKLVLIAPIQTSSDPRTTAMLMPTIDVLSELKLWTQVEPETAPLKTVRLIDGSKRLIRSPVTDFRCSEMGLEAFGYNVPNRKMIALLGEAVSKHPAIERLDAMVIGTQCLIDRVVLQLSNDDQLECDLVVAADGKESKTREAAGIPVKKWSYPQTAIVLNFAHSQPHNGVSAEFHTETGPFTQVPLPSTQENKQRSSLVWVVRPEKADSILNMPLHELSRMVEIKLQSCFGKVSVEGQPQAFPLAGMTASQFAANRVALIGEAGHVFPPIGAQGFNLGVRDILALQKALQAAADDFGGKSVLETYNRARFADVHLRTNGVDMLNRSLLTDFLPVQLVRTLGISALGRISWLRKLAMKQGLGAGAVRSASLSAQERNHAAANRSQ